VCEGVARPGPQHNLRSAEGIVEARPPERSADHLAADEPTCCRFSRSCKKRKVEWFTGLELTSRNWWRDMSRRASESDSCFASQDGRQHEGSARVELHEFTKDPLRRLCGGRLSPMQDIVVKENRGHSHCGCVLLKNPERGRQEQTGRGRRAKHWEGVPRASVAAH